MLVYLLAHFTVKCAPLKKRIELDLLQTAGSTKAFLVTGSDVAGSGLPFSFGLGAFEDDDVSWHG